jgi:aryl-alcohol dehydrogenase-like predicted oxidoreductase
MSTPLVESLELAPGYRISRLIKGGWQLAGDHGPVERERAIADMAAFPDAGVTTFDCADIYAGVEEMIGRFREDYGRRRGAEALSRIKVHTKLVPDAERLPPSRAEVQGIVERSLQRLGQDRLDLVQLHWWRYEIEGAVQTANWLKELQGEGKIELIGATNFDTPHLAAILESGVAVRSLQAQYSLLDRRPENGMLALLARHGAHLLAYGVLAGGLLTDAWLGRAEPALADLGNRSHVKYKLIIDDFGGWDLFQALLAACRRIGSRHAVSIANVATRWVLDRPGVGGAIIGARYAAHLPDNLGVFDFALDAADTELLNGILAESRGPGGDTFALERDRMGPHGRIMKYNLNAGSDRIG